LWRIEEAATRRQMDAYERAIVQAWVTAFVRVRTDNAKRVPSLAQLLEQLRPRRTGRRPEAMTVAQLRSALYILSGMYGGEVSRGRGNDGAGESGAP
jgi:hypothetical protein